MTSPHDAGTGSAWPPTEPRFRYRIQQDKGKYCLKQCDDGGLIDYGEHKLVVRGLLDAIAAVVKDARRWQSLIERQTHGPFMMRGFDKERLDAEMDLYTDAISAGKQGEGDE